MSQHQLNIAQNVRSFTEVSANPAEGEQAQNSLATDLIIIEAGLRLKVLPLRDALLLGRKLCLSEMERRTRQIALFGLNGNRQHNIVDVGLFADAVARRLDAAERLWRAQRSRAQR